MSGRELWARVDAVVDELLDRGLDDASRLSALRAHRLHLLVAAAARRRGSAVPPALRDAQRVASLAASSVPCVLATARAACDQPLLLMKGAEVAARYPDPLTRPFIDVDLLTPDAAAVQRSLLAAGFQSLGAADSPQHLAPLHLPGLPIRVEVHGEPHWVDGLRPPAVADVFDAAGPSAVGVPDVLAPAPEHHAVLLAVHAWTDRPLGRLGRLIDVEAMSLELDPARLDCIAREWGCGRLWRATRRAGQAALLAGRAPLSLKLWARHVTPVRDRTVLGAHLERWLAPVWAFPPRQAIGRTAAAVARDVSPHPGEGWAEKVMRVRVALTHADRPEPEHLASVPFPRALAAVGKEETR